jgi:hypothetical protein
MSDIPNDLTDAIESTTPADSGAKDFESLYKQEVQERIRERNLYRPVQQMLRDLDDGTVQAIQSLADLARNGDTSGIVDWSIATAQNLSGGDLASAIAARQAGGAPQSSQYQQQELAQTIQQQAPSIDPDMMRAMIQQEAAQQFRVQTLVQQITSELNSSGYEPSDPSGQTIIRYAQVNNVPIKDATAWFEQDVQAKVIARASAAAGAAAQTPQLAPSGSAPGSAPSGMTPAEAARARLEGYNRGAQ